MSVIKGKFSLGDEGLILDLEAYGKIVGKENIVKFLKDVGKEVRRYDNWVRYEESLKNPRLFVEDGYKDFITNE